MEDLDIVKIDQKNYLIFDQSRKSPVIIIPKIISPFGKENYNNVLYINFQLDNSNHELLTDIQKIEDYMKDYIKTKLNLNVDFLSSIKFFQKYKPLFKIRINNKIKCYNINNEQILMQDFNFKLPSTITISLNSIWNSKKNTGLIWYLDEIKNLV